MTLIQVNMKYQGRCSLRMGYASLILHAQSETDCQSIQDCQQVIREFILLVELNADSCHLKHTQMSMTAIFSPTMTLSAFGNGSM